MATKRGGNLKSLDALAREIIQDLKAHFLEMELSSSALSTGAKPGGVWKAPPFARRTPF
jgi:hypothetical protein